MNLRTITLVLAFAGVGLAGAHPAQADPPDPALMDTGSTHAESASGRGLVWRQHDPATSPPSGCSIAMAYDSARDRIVMFCGNRNETWTWNGSDWTQLHPAQSPGARIGASMAYDPVLDEIVLFGSEFGSDTWGFTGETWIRRQEASPFGNRRYTMMAFDPNDQRVLLYGGADEYDDYPWDTWEWTGTTWQYQSGAGIPGGGLTHAGLAYAPAREALMLYGGYARGYIYDATYGWNGQTWEFAGVAGSPQERMAHGLATFGRRVVLYGGILRDGSPSRETWVLGTSWHNRTPQLSPPTSNGHLVWDPVRREAVLFGTGGNQTWSLTRRHRENQ